LASRASAGAAASTVMARQQFTIDRAIGILRPPAWWHIREPTYDRARGNSNK
jgi:hypothetical protein